MTVHAIYRAVKPEFGWDTVCGPKIGQHSAQATEDLDKVTCEACLAEIEKRMPGHNRVTPFMTGMDVLHERI